jgi:hypothetical protein
MLSHAALVGLTMMGLQEPGHEASDTNEASNGELDA